eukprot:TRINITY_DN5967_c0_g1_i1.p1 TRINITY_DN5967_c0_g1~~TRINITY_DN5967_c0_g1_i1.p1  ORF type:complete len:453 (-),score=94.90 TRINITY_DN5967_c0_g1_i1:116-1474(-)
MTASLQRVPATMQQATVGGGGASPAASGMCSLGVAGLVCGVARDEAPELDVEMLDGHHLADEAPPLEFTGDYDLGGRHRPGLYSSSPSQPLVGGVLRRGRAWLLTEEGGVESAQGGWLSLYPNGLAFDVEATPNTPSAPSRATEALLAPFTFVRPVAKHSTALQAAISPNHHTKIFAATFFLKGRTLLFGVSAETETQATTVCMHWVRDVACAIRWVSESLFVHGSCFQVSPGFAAVGGGPGAFRLMASYLLLSDEHSEKVRVVYAELHAPRTGKAWMLLHETSSPNSIPWQEVVIDARTPCFEKVGHDSSIFCIGSLQLSARTVFERQLWLRAVANLKVKLQSKGPDPRPDELMVWREAINEHIWKNAAKLRNRVAAFQGSSSHGGRGDAYNLGGVLGASAVCQAMPLRAQGRDVDASGSGVFDDGESEAAGIVERFRHTPLLRECEAGAF